VKFPRASGVLLHPTSLPGRFGIGDFGVEAFRFADLLASSGQTIWQMLPLGPTAEGDSPYSLFSAFAGNPLLICPDKLAEEGLIDAPQVPAFPEDQVDFDAVSAWKQIILHQAYDRFRRSSSPGPRRAFADFCAAESGWLDPFALFMSLLEAHGGRMPWPEWSRHTGEGLEEEVEAKKFWQFLFFRQWNELREHCRKRGIRLMGDVPIYVAHNSADVWTAPKLYE
jgi:4-alpha-glucanotransferase